jgi:uncharacterized protein YecT (DUF1311 family)
MSPLGGDEADYVLIYDGENGLRMAPRAAAAAFEGQDPGHLEMAAPEPETAEASKGGQGAKIAAAIGAVAALGLLGFLVGRGPAPGAGPATVAPVAALTPPPTATPSAPTSRALAHRATKIVGHSAKRLAHGPVLHAAAHKTASHRTRACASARSLAERVVCRDPQLAAEDARLGRVLRSAALAGAPVSELEGGQTAWLVARDLAARRSRGEVAAVYRQRIQEVESLANETPPF